MSKKNTKMKLGEGLKKSQTDWARLDALRDEDIDCSDIPELDDTFWKNAVLVQPENKERLTVRFDADMVEWFKRQGRGYQTRMNTVLRSFYEAHKNEL
jgi:uncharacterized protein (DUF4415 family)